MVAKDPGFFGVVLIEIGDVLLDKGGRGDLVVIVVTAIIGLEIIVVIV